MYGLRRGLACAQVLLALYFFLAGCMVSQSRLMWVVPAASASFALLFAAISHASSMLSSTFRCARLTFWTNTSLGPGPLALGNLLHDCCRPHVHLACQSRVHCLVSTPSRTGGFCSAEAASGCCVRRQLSRDSKAWWCADVVHMLYSAAVFLSAAAYTLGHPRAFLITWSPARAEPGLLPDVLVCISAGFFGFQLWALVCTR